MIVSCVDGVQKMKCLKRIKMDDCKIHGYTLFELSWKTVTTEYGWKCTTCETQEKKQCKRCKNWYKKRELRGDHCTGCSKQIIDEKRKEQREKTKELLKTYDEKLKSCRNGGICDTLQMHHNILKDDPERLQTDFIIGLVCGKRMQNKYRKKQMEKTR